MNYLITGGSGLIGSRIVRDLIKENEHVVVFDLLPDEEILDQLLTEEEKKQIKIVQGDVTDLCHLMSAVQENDVEVIIHLAALLSEEASANPRMAIKVNCEGTANIFETAKLFGLKKTVWASSMSVFGTPDKYTEEYILNDAAHYPWGIYGASKSFNETLANHYFNKYDMDILAIRYSLVYGAGQKRGGSGALMRELVVNPALGKPGKVPYGDDEIGWLYVDDAARATVMASRTGKTKTRAFTISGDVHSMKKVAEYIIGLIPGADITLLPGYSGLSWKFDMTPLKNEVGYEPVWPMEKGIKEMVNIYRKQNGLPLV
jgi:nucleoside-diphosphate-sugar epimerase